jgi:hypothetical protein
MDRLIWRFGWAPPWYIIQPKHASILPYLAPVTESRTTDWFHGIAVLVQRFHGSTHIKRRG